MPPLLVQIQAHLRATGMPPTRFGREAAGDPRLVGDIRRGRTIGDRLAARVRAYIAARP